MATVEIVEARVYQPKPLTSRAGYPIRYKNKLVALLIDTFGLGMFGLDRIYLGCYLSGVIKFSLLVLGLLLVSTPNQYTIYTGLAFLGISVFWNLLDSISLYYNAITMNYGVPYIFCQSKFPVRWVSYQNMVDAKNVALVLILIFVLVQALGGVRAYESMKGIMAV